MGVSPAASSLSKLTSTRPDTKAHIPASLIQPSIEHAYASLSGPSSSTTTTNTNTAGAQQPPALDPRRPAEHGVSLHASAVTPIWSTHYLDPALDDACVLLPPSNPNSAPATKRKRRASSAQQQLQPMAINANWDVPPDGRFVAEDGAVDLTLGVVDAHKPLPASAGMAGMPGERTKAKIEVVSRDGEVKVDLVSVLPSSRKLASES